MQMSMKNKRAYVFLLVLSFLLLLPSAAFASYAYDYGDDEFYFTETCLGYADGAWNSFGLSWQDLYGPEFTEARVLGNMPYGNAFYNYSHGDPGIIYDNYWNEITWSEIKNAKGTDWKKFVFADSCNGSDNSNLASGFGISNGDGSNHAFLGWVGPSYDSYNYANFDYHFWNRVKQHWSVLDAAIYAQSATGISHYKFYGAPQNVSW